MPVANTVQINPINAQTITQVLQELERLSVNFERAGLPEFMAFNHAYCIITRAVHAALASNYFKNPEFVEAFTVCFAKYYFDVVHDAESGTPTLPGAWQTLSGTRHTTHFPKYIQLLLGANAHINHDLPLALASMLGSGDTRALLRDVAKVDRLLMQSRHEILGALTQMESRQSQGWLRQTGQRLCLRPVMYVILFWRVLAWRRYVVMRRHGTVVAGPTRHGKNIGAQLRMLGMLVR